MNPQPRHNDRKQPRSRRWLWGGITVVLVLMFLGSGIRMALKSDWLFDRIRDRVVEEAGHYIHGSLAIETIRGDLLRGFVVKNLRVRDETETELARVDSITVSYGFWSLVRSPHQIDEIRVKGGNFNLRQYDDSTWNVLRLIPEPETEEPAEPLYWSVEKIRIGDLNTDIRSDLLPDGVLNIGELGAELTAGAAENGFYGSLETLDFRVKESRLPDPVEVTMRGSGNENRVTLESLLVNTGRSLLRASGEYRTSGELEQNTELRPLSWEDIALYAGDIPIRQNLDVRIGAEGSLENLTLSLDATGEGIENFNLRANIRADDTPVLTGLELYTNGLNLPVLTGRVDWPVFGTIELTGAGYVQMAHPEDSRWEGELSADDIRYENYRGLRFSSSFSVLNQRLDLRSTLAYGGQIAEAEASIQKLFDNRPDWEVQARTDGMNLAAWLQDDGPDSDLDLRVLLSGSGFEPGELTSRADITITGRRFGEQRFSGIRFTGSVNRGSAEGTLRGQLDRSVAEAEFTIQNWIDSPSYRFRASLNGVNLAEVNGLEEFPTDINGMITGEGTSFDPEEMSLRADAVFDSSIVNGEQIEALRMDVLIENRFLHIGEGQVQSPIADASFSLRQHLSDYIHSENRMAFDATLKELQSLAPLFGYETVGARGTVSGRLERSGRGELHFEGTSELEDVQLDTLFSAEKAGASVLGLLRDEPELDLTLNLVKPVVYNTGVQDVQILSHIYLKESEITGTLDVAMRNGDQSSLNHRGRFRADSTEVWLGTDELEFTTRLRSLALVEPFDLTWSNDILKVDTLTMAAIDEQAFLSIWVPHVDSLSQHVGLDAQNLNVGKLQETVLHEKYFDGLLSGTVEVLRNPGQLDVTATGLLREFRLGEGEMDSLRFDAKVQEEWLRANLGSWHGGEQLAEADLQVPFIPGDPLTFDEEFFERDISGTFRLFETRLPYWFAFLPDGPPEQTSGNISAEMHLGGIAGDPELNGVLSVSDGVFSGIEIDRFGMNVAYQHADREIHLNGSVRKEDRSILAYDARLPFAVDLKRAEINFPSDDDSVFLNIRSDDFDLALLNSYMDREVVRQLSGRVEGNVLLTGTIGEPETNGQMQLTGGRMRLVQAGITLSETTANLIFEPDGIHFRQFSTRSGPGRLRASGSISLDGLTPGQFDVEFRASQFRAINTQEYNLLINLQATMSGTMEDPVLRGNLTFLTGQVNLQNFGDPSVEDVTLEDEEETEPYEFYDALAMEFSVNFGRQFLIRNRQYLDMEIALGGEVDLVKQKHDELQLFGTLDGYRGYARPLGRQFELDEATVAFSGPVDDPQLNITTRYTPPQSPGVNIFYIIEGTLQEPEFRFDSEPPLELQDIVGYTLFGKPFYELESWEQVVAGSGTSPSAADLALEVLLDRVEMLASRQLGIDVVQIDNSRSGSNSTTTIKTGWYLNQRTFFAILNEVGGARPKTLFMLEYLLRENLEMIITQGDDSREGIDLRWKHDY